MVEIKVENLDKIRDAFKNAPARVAPILRQSTIDAGRMIKNVEVKEAPHKTAGLQRSIDFRYFTIGVEISPSVDYAKFVVSGTNPHPIVARRARALRFIGRDGNVHFAKSVMHTGTKPNDFVGRTVEQVGGNVNNIYQDALRQIIDALL